MIFVLALQPNFHHKDGQTYPNDIVSVEDAASITAIPVFSNSTLHLHNKGKD